MSDNWNDILTNETVDLTPRPGFEAQLRAGLSDEWNGRPMITPDAPSNRARAPRRGWLLGAAAAGVLLVGGVVVATRPSSDSVVQTPVTAPVPTDVSTAPTTVPVAPPASDPIVGTTTPPTGSPASSGSIVVPLAPTTPIVVEPVATVPYGLGDEEIQVVNGEFPPRAVWHVGGILVLEDALQAGLNGDGVLVQMGDEADFGSGDRRIQPKTIDLAEPGGTPVGVRSMDGGGIVIVTVHDDDPAVRLRTYIENPPGTFSEFREGVDVSGLGDSTLAITADGVTWGGDVVIPPNASNPGATRPAVASDPAFSFASEYTVTRSTQDAQPALEWNLDVELDADFPPGPVGPLVEPFGDGVLFAVNGSSARDAQPTVMVLDPDGTGAAFDLDGWRLDDVRPEGAIVTRSTQEGLEIGILRPAAASEPLPQGLEGWPTMRDEPVSLDGTPRLLPSSDIDGVVSVSRFEVGTDVSDLDEHQQVLVATDGSGYVEINTRLTTDDLRLGGETPVEIDGWVEAYLTPSPQFTPTSTLVLLSSDGTVMLSGYRLGDERVVEIARSMTRRSAGERGWDVNAAGMVEFGGGGRIDSASRRVEFDDQAGRVAELTVGNSLVDSVGVGWSPDSTAQVFDIDGRTALAVDSGFATAVYWTLSDDIGVLLGYRGSADEAIELARSITEVDQATWEARTTPGQASEGGCTSLFC